MRSIYPRLVQWGFNRLYHEWAWSYDFVAATVSRGYWRRWITALVPYLRGGPVLELGCGTGYLQLALAQAGLPHTGYDASPQMLRQATRRIERAGYIPRLLRGRSQALPFAASRFNDVVATFPTPYILDPATLAEVRRVLAPGGQLVILDGGQLDRGIYEKAVEVAYRATLQSGEGNRYAPRLQAAGFEVTWQRVVVERSSVGIMLARPIPYA